MTETCTGWIFDRNGEHKCTAVATHHCALCGEPRCNAHLFFPTNGSAPFCPVRHG